MKRSVLMIGFVYGPGLLVLLMIIYMNDTNMRTNFLTILIGMPIIALLFLVLFKIKQHFHHQAKTLVPAMVVFAWIFLYIPLAAIIPAA